MQGEDHQEGILPIIRRSMSVQMKRLSRIPSVSCVILCAALSSVSQTQVKLEAVRNHGSCAEIGALDAGASGYIGRDGARVIPRTIGIQLLAWERFKSWPLEHPYVTLVLGFYPLVLLVCFLLFWLRPLWLLRLNNTLSALDFALPSWLGGVKLPLRYVTLVGFFHYRPRVLDAWVAQYISVAREQFHHKQTVQQRDIHISLPVTLDKRNLAELKPENLRATFARNLCSLVIWGEGGSGKTSLACLLAKWAMSPLPSERLATDHLMLPILIEQDLEPQGKSGEQALLRAIRDQLRALINEPDPPPEELLSQLVKRRRVLLIIDSFSEMSNITRADMLAGVADIPVNCLIITSRSDEQLNTPKSAIKPLRITSNKLASFMESYLSELGQRNLFDDEEFFDVCRRLSAIVADREITPLLMRLYADQVIRTKTGITNENLPSNIPELMLSYLNDINRRGAPRTFDDRTVHETAGIIAWECLKNAFRPMPANLTDVQTALGGDERATALLNDLENRLKLVQTVGVSRDRIRFSVDPLAEYLAGLHLIRQFGADEASWRDFLLQAGQQEDVSAIKGFLLAVRDGCETVSAERVPTFVAEELGKLGGVDAQEGGKARSLRRLKKLIRELTSVDDDERCEAAKALREMKAEATPAVPALVKALDDEHDTVRRSVCNALREIGRPAKTAVPKLISLLDDANEDISSSAAFALRVISPETTAELFIPVLIKSTRNSDDDVASSARYVLRNLGSEAKPATQRMIELLKDPEPYVRRHAAYVLGRIGADATDAIGPLIEMFKDRETTGMNRSAAVQALEKIGAVTIPHLIPALQHKDVAMRLGAVYVLGRLGPQAQGAADALRETLRDGNEDVRVGASYALVNVGPGVRPKDAVPALIKMLSDPNPSTRWGAVIALGSMGVAANAAIPMLIRLLKDSDENVQDEAACVLKKFGPAAIPALENAVPLEGGQARKRLQIILDTIRTSGGPALPE